MTGLIVLAAIVVAVLERTHRRQPPPVLRTAGSSDIRDRDLERVRAELAAVAVRES